MRLIWKLTGRCLLKLNFPIRPSLSGDLQPRLFYGLEQLLYTPAVSSFMLVKAPEEPEYLQWLAAETGLCTSLPHRFTASAMR